MASPNINYRSLAEETANPFRDAQTPATTTTAAKTTITKSDDAKLFTAAAHLNDDVVGHDEEHLVLEHENEDTPRDMMIHIVPEMGKESHRWNHIEDLDSFFSRMYNYQQKHGFRVIVLDEVFQVLEFGFVVWLLTFVTHCIRHDVLFGNVSPEHNSNRTKTTISDVIIPRGECIKSFGIFTYLIIFLAAIYLGIRLLKMIYHITQYADIRRFYNQALRIEDSDLDNITWHDVQQRTRKVQAEQHMCIDKELLTELDIYHRVLRFKNYLVALMNKQLLPVRFHLPLIGEVVSLSRGMLFNIDFILFRGPGSPFQNNWQLRDEFAVRSNQTELAQRLSKLILGVALVNLLLAPVIFLWQLIYFSFSYANILRKEPSALGLRTWSNYGRLYLRHFNELDHELDARLNRAYEYADRYLSSFSSPLAAVIARNFLFVSGGVLLLILAFGIYDEHVFQVEHVLTIIAVLTVIGVICRTLIPDENLIWCPEQLMTAILAHVHYLPTEWKQQAHTAHVRNEFGNFFQFKAGYLLSEIFSPFVTPFVLIFVFRPKAMEIVKFFRSFTVSVRGVGNVCSFAQMDVRKHGNPDWQITNSGFMDVPGLIPEQQPQQQQQQQPGYQQTQQSMVGGKTEMSLVRFTLNNPEWQMPKEASQFIKGIREHAIDELVKAKTAPQAAARDNPLTHSLISFGNIGEEYCSIANSVLAAELSPEQLQLSQSMAASRSGNPDVSGAAAGVGSDFRHMLQQNLGEPMSSTSFRRMSSSMGPADSMRRLRLSKAEGRIEGPADTLLYSLYGVEPRLAKNPIGVTVADMCLSALYLHELSQQKRMARQSRIDEAEELPGPSNRPPRPHDPAGSRMGSGTGSGTGSGSGSMSGSRHTVITSKAAESTPLLGNIRS
ncbi:autophagy-related protein 9A [Drosophila grimshawi]|uniref:Autophagy-related protein 9 n=1 Tax=Drosophila grimshawi TaxID=7222 RepID=B4J944_DROGR|nr:autophagy-related protein 9A [Drosophila grimshawi]EDW02419.1 GH19901 [Drosophila grimshawi]